MKQLKIGSSWIRGIVGNGLTPELVTDFACAFGTYLDARPIVLARDTRRSSPMLASAAVAGLLSTGAHVLNAGVCPTPIAQYLVRRKRAGGGLVVSGSHNDFRWNALKFINADGALLNPVQGEELLDLYHAGEFTKAPWDRLGREITINDYVPEYLAATVGRLDVASIRQARFRVVLDLGNGTCGTAAAAFFSMLGCRPILINEETEGDFARDPAPTPANMRQLASLLKHLETDVGFAVNTDVDRVGLVTDRGEALSEECTLPLVADHLLRDSGHVVVTNLSTSQMIERVVEARNGRLVRTKIGEGNVVFRSLNEHALLGGEGSGGVAYLPIVHGFDGYLVMGLVLEAMAQSGRGISELAANLPSFCMRKGVVPCAPDRVYYALEEIRRLYRDQAIDLSDGVRVAWPGRWLHVRASNTEPILRIIAEGEDEDQLDRLFADTVGIVNTVVHGKS